MHGFESLTVARDMISWRSIPRGVILGGLIAMGLTLPAFAGLDDGLAAYDRGDYATAYRELAPAAAGGAPLAQYNLARMYFTGEGVSRDSDEGLKWLRKAAMAGVGLAQYQLGARHEWGIDVAQDYGEAARWLARRRPSATGEPR